MTQGLRTAGSILDFLGMLGKIVSAVLVLVELFG